jgi:hypothetical protein
VLRRLAIGALFAGAACASASRSSRCAPIDPELYEDYGGLYDECTVEQRARLTSQPRVDYPYQPPRNVYCLIGELRFVVDTFGRALPQTVEVVRANDERYIEVMVNALPQLRFTPGRVKRRAVNQIARWESHTVVGLPVSTSRNPTARNSSC